ncbi:MAG TPA: hypothetical protein V6D13_03570 [Halomicronema sp.]
MEEEKTPIQRKFTQKRYCRMIIVKKLPAVLITTVGISFGVVGTALAETILVDNKTLGPEEQLEFTPPGYGQTLICFETSDNFFGTVIVVDTSTSELKQERFFPGPKTKTCISRDFNRYPIIVINSVTPNDTISQSIRVRVIYR